MYAVSESGVIVPIALPEVSKCPFCQMPVSSFQYHLATAHNNPLAAKQPINILKAPVLAGFPKFTVGVVSDKDYEYRPLVKLLFPAYGSDPVVYRGKKTRVCLEACLTGVDGTGVITLTCAETSVVTSWRVQGQYWLTPPTYVKRAGIRYVFTAFRDDGAYVSSITAIV